MSVSASSGHDLTAAAGRSLRSHWRCLLWCSLIAFPFAFTLSMTDGLSHDEAQHLSAGALLAREGLLPYRDFPHFHTPYLAFVYSVLFRCTDHLLLAGRLFSTCCATAAVGLVGMATAHAFRAHSPRLARCAIAGALILTLGAQIFIYTTGHAWNHEPPLLCALAAFLTLVSGVARAKAVPLFASGLLLGLAIGLRLTYAPLLAPFGLAALTLGPTPARCRLVLAAWFSGGVLLALSGLAWLAILAPEQTWFGNFDFARVNVVYRFATGEPRTMTIPTKLRYLSKNVGRPNFPICLAFFGPLAAAVALRWRHRRPLPLALIILLWSLPFLLLGSFAPSPLFPQYFYPFVFFFVLGAAFSLASLPARSRVLLFSGGCAAVSLGFAVISAVPAYRGFAELWPLDRWTTFELHAQAGQFRSLPPLARVLTLEPMSVLEANRRIYPGFAPGPFAWRVSPFIEPSQAARLHITSPQSLPALLAADPPAALLLRVNLDLEIPLRDYATSHGFQPLDSPGALRLWVRP